MKDDYIHPSFEFYHKQTRNLTNIWLCVDNGFGLCDGGEFKAQMFNLAQMVIRIPNVQFSIGQTHHFSEPAVLWQTALFTRFRIWIGELQAVSCKLNLREMTDQFLVLN